ncbi:MAG TPA: hypothetical protein HPP87_01995 [Planctomycetes bacterium]|nr:hypothetical protein [Planctomycetota bacterium]
MSRTNLQKDSPESEEQRRFSQSQYDMLLGCSGKKDITEWNRWRKDNPDEEVLLERADFKGAFLRSADMKEAFLKGADLNGAQMTDADFSASNLNDAKLRDSDLKGADLSEARVCGADFYHAHMEVVDLTGADLSGAKLLRVHLQHGSIFECNLEGADLWRAHLEGVFLSKSCLKGANFTEVIVSGATLIDNCRVDRRTDFSGVGLHQARIDPGTRQLLEYNARRKHWEVWYEGHVFLKWPVKWFWALSDYGLSTLRVMKWFLIFAIFFAVVYYLWGAFDYHFLGIESRPGIVSSLFVLEETNEPVSSGQAPVRALYFSIVTMTTLGFGDMYANVATKIDNMYANMRCVCGHLLLTIQVIMGYVLLGALVTRFAVLFTAGGPAGKFEPIDKDIKTNVKT